MDGQMDVLEEIIVEEEIPFQLPPDILEEIAEEISIKSRPMTAATTIAVSAAGTAPNSTVQKEAWGMGSIRSPPQLIVTESDIVDAHLCKQQKNTSKGAQVSEFQLPMELLPAYYSSIKCISKRITEAREIIAWLDPIRLQRTTDPYGIYFYPKLPTVDINYKKQAFNDQHQEPLFVQNEQSEKSQIQKSATIASRKESLRSHRSLRRPTLLQLYGDHVLSAQERFQLVETQRKDYFVRNTMVTKESGVGIWSIYGFHYVNKRSDNNDKITIDLDKGYFIPWERIEAYCFHKMNAAETNDTAKEHIGLALFTKPRFKHAETIDPLVWDSCEKILIWPVEERQMLDWIRVLRQYTIGQIYPMSTNQTQNFIKSRRRQAREEQALGHMSDEPNINWIWIDDKMQYGFDEGWPSYSQNTLDILKAAQTDQAILKAIIEKAMTLWHKNHERSVKLKILDFVSRLAVPSIIRPGDLMFRSLQNWFMKLQDDASMEIIPEVSTVLHDTLKRMKALECQPIWCLRPQDLLCKWDFHSELLAYQHVFH